MSLSIYRKTKKQKRTSTTISIMSKMIICWILVSIYRKDIKRSKVSAITNLSKNKRKQMTNVIIRLNTIPNYQ